MEGGRVLVPLIECLRPSDRNFYIVVSKDGLPARLVGVPHAQARVINSHVEIVLGLRWGATSSIWILEHEPGDGEGGVGRSHDQEVDDGDGRSEDAGNEGDADGPLETRDDGPPLAAVDVVVAVLLDELGILWGWNAVDLFLGELDDVGFDKTERGIIGVGGGGGGLVPRRRR